MRYCKVLSAKEETWSSKTIGRELDKPQLSSLTIMENSTVSLGVQLLRRVRVDRMAAQADDVHRMCLLTSRMLTIGKLGGDCSRPYDQRALCHGEWQ